MNETKIEIINDDSLCATENLGRQFDYLITDPPYPTGGESSIRSASGVIEARLMIDSLSLSIISKIIRNINPTKGCFIFCDWRVAGALSLMLRSIGYSRCQSCVVWDKMSGSLSSSFHPSYEMILVAMKETKDVYNTKYLGRDLISCKRVPKKQKTHVFEKPIELIHTLIKGFNPGSVIDPFCGTGSILVACKSLGWNDVTGIEISPKSCEVARERLSNLSVLA